MGGVAGGQESYVTMRTSDLERIRKENLQLRADKAEADRVLKEFFDKLFGGGHG